MSTLTRSRRENRVVTGCTRVHDFEKISIVVVLLCPISVIHHISQIDIPTNVEGRV